MSTGQSTSAPEPEPKAKQPARTADNDWLKAPYNSQSDSVESPADAAAPHCEVHLDDAALVAPRIVPTQRTQDEAHTCASDTTWSRTPTASITSGDSPVLQDSLDRLWLRNANESEREAAGSNPPSLEDASAESPLVQGPSTARPGVDEREKFRSRYVRMEERLEDDLLNTYCDKLHEAVNKEVDGLLAIQYILVEPGLLKTFVTGQKRVCQVLYDEDRQHYLSLVRSVGNVAPVVVYDPLVPSLNSLDSTLNTSVCKQIAALFRHLYGENDAIEVAVEAGVFPQTDSWSCGLRAVAHITHLVLGVDPLHYEYELECIREFFSLILDTQKPPRQYFNDAKFGNLCKKRESRLLRAQITRNGELVIRANSRRDISPASSREGTSDGRSARSLRSDDSISGKYREYSDEVCDELSGHYDGDDCTQKEPYPPSARKSKSG